MHDGDTDNEAMIVTRNEHDDDDDHGKEEAYSGIVSTSLTPVVRSADRLQRRNQSMLHDAP